MEYRPAQPLGVQATPRKTWDALQADGIRPRVPSGKVQIVLVCQKHLDPLRNGQSFEGINECPVTVVREQVGKSGKNGMVRLNRMRKGFHCECARAQFGLEGESIAAELCPSLRLCGLVVDHGRIVDQNPTMTVTDRRAPVRRIGTHLDLCGGMT